MKILLVSPKMENPNGGIAVWTDLYLNACEERDIECEILNTAMIGERAKNGNSKRNYFDEIKRTRRIFKDLKECLKKKDYDSVHINSSCGTFGIIRDFLVAKKIRKSLPKTKIVVHFHCDIPFQIKNNISRHFLKKMLTVSDENIVLCETSKDYLVKEFGISSIIIPNFIDELYIKKTPKEIKSTVSKVFFVGRVQPEKGALELYEVAKRFPQIEFELAGALDQTVMQWEKPDNIKLLGLLPHEEIIRRMDESDVFVFPSYSEGFSIALLESMARGIPAIATDVGANKEMLSPNCGYIVEKQNVQAIENALNQMSQELRKMYSHNAIEKVNSKYSVSCVMACYLGLYLEGKGK